MADENILTLLDLAGLLYRQRSGALSPVEHAALDSWLAADPANQTLADELSRPEWLDENLAALDPVAQQASAARVYQALGMETPVVHIGRRPVRQIGRWVAAASVVAVLAAGAYFGLFRRPHVPVAQTRPVLRNDVPAPTGTKTTLTLESGQTILLDSASNGTLVEQGNAQVSKLTANQLVYNTLTTKPTAAVYNTLSTAKGGQTMVVLADGTKVWLNALSSLRYPTAFTGATREVELTGEAYFDVAHHAAQPFRVRAGQSLVEDIGTRFDVNAYSDEPALTATLLQGSARVDGRALTPGQAAAVDKTGQLVVRSGADSDEVLGWMNGEFVFNRLDEAAILRQIGRWYDIDIVPPAAPMERTFSGIVSRKSNLSDVMKILEGANIRFRIEGRKMILLQ